MNKDILTRLTSRKFLLALVGIVIVSLQAYGVNISDSQRDAIIQLIMAFTAAEGIADAVSRLK